MKLLVIGALAIVLCACDAKIDDLQLYVTEVQQNTPVSIEPYPEFDAKPTFIYSAESLRSPFQHPRNVGVEMKPSSQPNCAQPEFARTKQPLEKFGIDALSVTGVFTSNGKKWALIQSNTGSLFKVTKGDHLGLFFGTIDSINNGTVSFTEMLPDGAGCWQKKQATLTMLSKAGENNV
ncbi:pilus assembly protein PilP [Paraglaciecola hydrolytica]|uniref:Pilus assembly protein PilP n=1 Tax=Paraglaciecola hydrolytica TaxID=1799789 RepID=A0A136A1R2_9ALTE|nr:pilus assembly protein PilP [Paraglaciecola hydrolytica]KXI29188.1 pilus assembly protein PilP [Paraglaciecola hydrolytica]